jgi:PAS domain S-box-containing protein
MAAESERLRALHSYEILDTLPEERFDRLTQLAAELLGAPIALISLVDNDRQWFKSVIGLDVPETPRAWSFCDHTSHAGPHAMLVVQDATQDPRFLDNPLVTGKPHIRFYAGVALTAPSGQNVGTLCTIDTVARPPPSPQEQKLLRAFAAIVMDELELGRLTRLGEEREMMLRLAGSMAGIGHWHLTMPGHVLTWSDEMYRIHGLTPGAFKLDLDTALAFLHREDRPVMRNIVALARIGGQGFSCRMRLIRVDGELRHVQCRTECRFDRAGTVTALVGVVQDITPQIDAARELEETNARFRLLAEHARDMVSHVGQDGVKHYVSPAARLIYGLSPDEILKRDILDFIHPDDAPSVAQLQLGLLTGRISEGTASFRVKRQDGTLTWAESSARSLRDEVTGQPDGYVAVTRDISELHAATNALLAREEELRLANASLERLTRHLGRARDHAEESNEAKSRFLTAMSHELRTPLNGILGYAQLLRLEGGLEDPQKRQVDAMLGAGEHLLSMINKVLDIAEIETSRIEVRSEKVDLRRILRTCLDLVRPGATRKSLALISVIAPGTPETVLLDQTRLRQILLNLLGNAVKYTTTGAVELRLGLTEDRTALRFEVIDTGPGIPPDRRDMLFREFERLGIASSGPVEGIGLGLSISAKLATMMGGAIGHEQPAAGGSLFWLTLPLAEPSADPAEQAAPPGTSDAAPVRPGTRILVVDDIAMNRDIAGAFLRAAGYEVSLAEGGAEAVAVATTEDFDLLLVDVRMPEIDGLEVTRRIRALPTPRAGVPIVALTAQSFGEQIVACRNAGMGGHLAKPYTREDLLRTVAEAIAAGPAAWQPHPEPAPAAATVSAQPAPPRPDIDAGAAPVWDDAAFQRTAAYLEPEALEGHVRTLVARSEDLLGSLTAPPDPHQPPGDLAFAAHVLAGSAGMFGFQRLSLSARQYEHAIENDLPEKSQAIKTLVTAIEISLQDMRRRAFEPAA